MPRGKTYTEMKIGQDGPMEFYVDAEGTIYLSFWQIESLVMQEGLMKRGEVGRKLVKKINALRPFKREVMTDDGPFNVYALDALVEQEIIPEEYCKGKKPAAKQKERHDEWLTTAQLAERTGLGLSAVRYECSTKHSLGKVNRQRAPRGKGYVYNLREMRPFLERFDGYREESEQRTEESKEPEEIYKPETQEQQQEEPVKEEYEEPVVEPAGEEGTYLLVSEIAAKYGIKGKSSIQSLATRISTQRENLERRPRKDHPRNAFEYLENPDLAEVIKNFLRPKEDKYGSQEEPSLADELEKSSGLDETPLLDDIADEMPGKPLNPEDAEIYVTGKVNVQFPGLAPGKRIELTERIMSELPHELDNYGDEMYDSLVVEERTGEFLKKFGSEVVQKLKSKEQPKHDYLDVLKFEEAVIVAENMMHDRGLNPDNHTEALECLVRKSYVEKKSGFVRGVVAIMALRYIERWGED